MQKSQIWILILMVAIPIIAFAVMFIATGLSIREIPLWAITIVPVLLFPLALHFVKRYDAQPTENLLRKKRKKFLIIWGSYAVFLAMLLIIAYYRIPEFFFPFLLIQFCFLLGVFFLNIRLFFPKKEMPTKESEN